MNFDIETLNNRKPLWLALSDLFLDTELQDYNFEFIAQAMKQFDNSLDEIHEMLMQEAFPVCIANLHSAVGEWAGFNEEWLIEAIISAKRPNRFRRWKNRCSFWMIKDDWDNVVKQFDEL